MNLKVLLKAVTVFALTFTLAVTVAMAVAVIFSVTAAHAQELTPIAQIKSPDTGSTYAYGDAKKRALYWSEKKQELSAQITFSDAKYATQVSEETLEFRLPGVRYDKDKKEFYVVMAKDNQRVLFAVRKKAFMGTSIVPVRNAVIRVIKTGSSVNIVADIYKAEEVAGVEKAEKEQEQKEKAKGSDGQEVKVKSLFDQ
ncbi:MAG: hypothetical protein ACAI35_03970 [Candidatus Methylacidiphilales bacterium]|nr:hypothetical protein [Candidatus Methylacidiphilales bacterium]